MVRSCGGVGTATGDAWPFLEDDGADDVLRSVVNRCGRDRTQAMHAHVT